MTQSIASMLCVMIHGVLNFHLWEQPACQSKRCCSLFIPVSGDMAFPCPRAE